MLCVVCLNLISFDDVSMDGNQALNPLDYSQSAVAYKDSNGNSRGSTASTIDPNGTMANLINQVKYMRKRSDKSHETSYNMCELFFSYDNRTRTITVSKQSHKVDQSQWPAHQTPLTMNRNHR